MLLTHCTIPDFEHMAFETAHILIEQEHIAHVFRNTDPPAYEGEVKDCSGMYVCPGLCDGHIHIESSRLNPSVFADTAASCGTTSVFADPHEIANVLGVKGAALFLDRAEKLSIDLFIGVPSCVPATHLETSGSTLTLKNIEKLLEHKRVYGLAEMMNVPGIVHDIGDTRARVEAALKLGKVVDGHCPGLSGDDLATYITNGHNDGAVRIMSDHECTSYEEAREKYEAGMHIMLRYGSASKDLPALFEGFVSDRIYSDRLILVCDDITAQDLRRKGHINHVHHTAMNILSNAGGLSQDRAFLHALKMCTANTCSYFGIRAGRIRPGYRANLVIHTDTDKIEPETVICRGAAVYTAHRGTASPASEQPDYNGYTGRMHVEQNPDICARSEQERPLCRVIGLVPDSIITQAETAELETEHGCIIPSPEQGIAKLCVIERHRGTGNRGIGFVKGFAFREGAVASTVAHDSHNIIAAGFSDDLIMKAVDLLRDAGGGLAAVTQSGSCLLRLDIAGLMSSESIDHVIEQEKSMASFTAAMGFSQDPFPALSFLALPVIPELKLTDRGLVDVSAFDFVPLEVS